MFQNKDAINTTAAGNGGTPFAASSYWSSTEATFNGAKIIDFTDGTDSAQSKNNTHGVRAIRAF